MTETMQACAYSGVMFDGALGLGGNGASFCVSSRACVSKDVLSP